MRKEKNKRLAQTELPGGKIVEREWTPHERYMLYAKGFRDGAGVKPIDKEREGLGAYDRGYEDGIAARCRAMKKYSKEIGYKPQILRLAKDRRRAMEARLGAQPHVSQKRSTPRNKKSGRAR